MPKRSEIIKLINEVRRILFPGYFGSENTAYVSLESFAASTLAFFIDHGTGIVIGETVAGRNSVVAGNTFVAGISKNYNWL